MIIGFFIMFAYVVLLSLLGVSYAMIPQKLQSLSIKTGKQFLLNLIPYYTLIVSIVEEYKSLVEFEKSNKEYQDKYGDS